METTKTLDFRPLRADEIDVRVGKVGEKGVTMLLYKNARVDMTILDETVGSLNWQREHLRDNANCIVSIWNDNLKQWIRKEDTGTESFTEAEKGLASDSFKRACTNWGIGRELYESPFIFLPCATKENPIGKGYVMKNKYEFSGIRVAEIEYAELDKKRIVSKLVLDINGKEVFRWTLQNSIKKELEENKDIATDEEKGKFIKRCESLGFEPIAILKRTGWVTGSMTKEQLARTEIIFKEELEAREQEGSEE